MKRKWLLALALPAVLFLLATEPWTAFIVTEAQEPAPPGASAVSRGAMVSLEHESSGTAQIVEGSDGKRWLRLDPFVTSNGPDVVVMLSPKKPDGWLGYDAAGHVILGALKGSRGAQNYELPAGLDLSKYASAVVWCQRFKVGFAAAALEPI